MASLCSSNVQTTKPINSLCKYNNQLINLRNSSSSSSASKNSSSSSSSEVGPGSKGLRKNGFKIVTEIAPPPPIRDIKPVLQILPNPSIYSNKKKKSEKDPYEIVKKIYDIEKSPWKMRFLLMLVRRTWVPDALAQLKFTAKHQTEHIARNIFHCIHEAKTKHDLLPEELIVKEIIGTKGQFTKKIRIMGRGRTGVGYTRRTHVTLRVTKCNFKEMIAKAPDRKEKLVWLRRMNMVRKLKEAPKAMPPP